MSPWKHGYRKPVQSFTKHHIPAVIALILGIALSIAAYRTVDNWEREEINHEFERQVGNLSSALQTGMESHFEVLYSLRAFYEGSHNVDRPEFTTFLEGSLERHDGFQAIECFCQDPGHGGLADAPGTRKEICVGDMGGFDGVFECLRNSILTDDVIESLRTIPSS